MTVLTTDAWALALAAAMAILLSHTTFTLAVQSSTARSRGCACIVLLSSLALGFGLWTTDFVQIPSVWLSERSTIGVSLLVTFAIAVSSQACALLFIAGREPDTSGMAGSAFALAIGVEATHCATLDELPGELVLREGLPWVCSSFLLAFVAFLAALWVWLKLRHDLSWRAHGARLLVALACALAILGTNAQTLVNSRLVFDSCCDKSMSSVQLLAISAAALGCAVLAVAQVIAYFCDKLTERAGRNARELEEVHARLQYLATHDSLTGLPNRQRFKDRLVKSIADTERPGRAIAVAVLDLDHFSTINHSLGHGVGDWLLTEVARRVTAVISHSTTLARLHGDEFA
ncbi:MAG TPA: GGDEF domain-containing protein, partial [Steroidobacteraceae bacterium]